MASRRCAPIIDVPTRGSEVEVLGRLSGLGERPGDRVLRGARGESRAIWWRPAVPCPSLPSRLSVLSPGNPVLAHSCE